MAKKGLRVKALIYLTCMWTVQNVASREMEDRIDVSQLTYQELTFEDNTSDGAYIMEILMHATDPDKATRKSYRALRPGGTITYIEYEHDDCKDPAVARKLSGVNKYVACLLSSPSRMVPFSKSLRTQDLSTSR